MKILRLHFKNINSLQGENQLDFNQAPLVNAGVFAITGPNGSGKSSILDVITLALYGETFKFDRPSAHVMTRHSTESFAVCEFQVNHQQYRCRWQAQQVGENATALPIAMTLTQLGDNETVLATDSAQVRALVTEITGLNFRNFTRSTLLAQGDFAAFLNALDSERLDILEKMISTDIYAEYQQDIIQKAALERSHLDTLQADLVAMPLLDSAAQETHELDLADFKAQVADFQQALQDLTQQMSKLQTLAMIDEQHQQALTQQQNLQQQLQQIDGDLQRIEVSHAAISLQDEAELIIEQQAILESDQLTLTHYREELTLLQAQLDGLGEQALNPELIIDLSVGEQMQVIADLSFQTEHLQAENSAEAALINNLETQLKEKKSEIQQVKTWLDEHPQEISLVDNFPDLGQLKNLAVHINELKQKQKSSSKTAKQSLLQLQNNQAEVQSLSKQVPELQRTLKAHEAEMEQLLKGHQLDYLEELRLEQQERVKDYQELIALAKVQHRFKDSLFVRLGLVKPSQDLNIDKITQQLDELNSRLLTEENIKKTLEQAVFNETLLKKMQADRQHLIDNEPCPLCGALKHPFSHHAPSTMDSKQAFIDQTARVQVINANIAKWQQQLKTAQKQADSKKLKADRLTRIQSEWAALCNRLNIASNSLSIDNPAPIKSLLQAQATELKDIVGVIKSVKQAQQKIVKVTAQIEAQSITLNNLQGILQTQVDTGHNPQVDSDTLNQTLQQAILDEQQLAKKVAAQLEQLGEKMPTKSKAEEALFNRLNQRRQTYQTYLLRDKKLIEEVDSLQQKIALSRSNIETQTQRLQNSSTKLHREQMSGLHLAVIEKQKLINEKELKVTQLKTQQQSQQHALQAQAAQYGIQSYSELRHVLALLPQQTALKQQQQQLEAEQQQLMLNGQKLLDQKQAIHVSTNRPKVLEDCEVEQQRLLEKIDIAQMEIQHLEAVLSEQQHRQTKVVAIMDEIAQQQARFEQANAELQQLNADQGHAFRRKVQRNAADKLLSKTNQILEKISGRFYIRQGDNEQGFALEVEDTFQNNTRRIPKTLSGGESFVVSLALALGLSELASNGQAIESLFLDEGFGNLDAEALYTVVSTLENLQTQGKKVGVISHVEGVRKRIKTQIEMVKKPDGLSEFRLLV